MNNKKQKIIQQSKVSKIVKQILIDFETAEQTFRFADVSSNRSKYNRDIDKAFYNHAKSYLEKLCKLLVLVNAGEMYHLHMFKQDILKHKKEISSIYQKIEDIKL